MYCTHTQKLKNKLATLPLTFDTVSCIIDEMIFCHQKPELQDLDKLGLKVTVAKGSNLNYLGYIDELLGLYRLTVYKQWCYWL